MLPHSYISYARFLKEAGLHDTRDHFNAWFNFYRDLVLMDDEFLKGK